MDTMDTDAVAALKHVVILSDGRRTFTFRVDGHETPAFFRKLAAYAVAHDGL